MFTLRLLGGAALESGEGPVTGRAAQRRRLALLSLLATAPGNTLSRDKLLGLLWPESDTEQGRHLISVALYELRRALGEEALESRGDDVHLSPERVRSDLAEFEAALDAGDEERAVALYAGPLLDGFFVSDAPEFERWVERERERVEHRYRGALEALAVARAAAGDRGGAVEAWRRLAARDPYNSQIAAALMRALADAGDRAGALQHARIHEALLREEYGLEPDPAVLALAERLREEPARPEAPAPPPPERPAAQAVTAPPAADPAPAPRPPAARARRRIRAGRSVLAGATGALLVLAMVVVWSGARSGPPDAAPPPPATSVAVLPFDDVSPDGASEYFADGLTEEITTALDRVEGLRVASRTSAFAFRDHAGMAGEVGRQLGVTHLLEGSVRRADDQLRIIARLVDVGSGYTVWSESYERRLRDAGDVLRVQDDIARAVMGALRVELVGGDATPLVRASTRDLQAYDLYWLGRHHLQQRTPAAFQQAIATFQRAIERDSAYALPYAGLADVLGLLASQDYGVLPPRQVVPQARAAAVRALELDPELAEAHATLGNIHLTYDWDVEAADREFSRALRLDPGYAQAHHWYSLVLLVRGRHPEALAEIRRARELEPLSLVMSTALGRHLYYARAYDRAIAEYRRALELDSTYVNAHLGLGLTYVQSGQPALALDEYRAAVRRLGAEPPVVLALMAHAHARAGETERARELLRSLEAASATTYIPPEYIALVHVSLGDADQAFHWLERAYQNRSPSLAFARVEPLLDPLRGDPRFAALLERVGI